MSMFGGGRGRGRFADRRRNRQGAVVELTPLIDITFQLLIFFLLTATFRDFSSLDVDLTEAENKEQTKEQKAILVSIGSEGELEIEQQIVELEKLESMLCRAKDGGKSAVHIRADKSADVEHAIQVMAAAKRCGIKSAGLLHNQ